MEYKILSHLLKDPQKEFKETDLIRENKVGKGAGADAINRLCSLNIIESVEQSYRSFVLRKLLVKFITLERAAMEAGVSFREIMNFLQAIKILAHYDLEDLEDFRS